MSRIGLKPIPVPDKVQIALNKSNVQVDGPKRQPQLGSALKESMRHLMKTS